MPTNRIGTFDVISLTPRPPSATEQVVLETRSGSDGVAAWKTGVRGRPYAVTTVVDANSLANAQALCTQYEALTGTLVSIRHAGQLMPFTVLVMQVDATPEKIVKGFGGTIGGQSDAIVRAKWKLITWS